MPGDWKVAKRASVLGSIVRQRRAKPKALRRAANSVASGTPPSVQTMEHTCEAL